MLSVGPLIAGVDFQNANLGVSALGLSALALLGPRMHAPVAAFDLKAGRRIASPEVLRHAGVTDPDVTVTLHGFRQTRRPYAADSSILAELTCRTGLCLGSAAAAIRNSSAVLDASGGDSFADIYGAKRFIRVSRPKRMALALNRPLVLLPQTFGPYRTPRFRREAAEIVARSTCAIARDAHSFDILKDLLGDRFDASRHLCGTDMAFRLPTIDPSAEALAVVARARECARGEAVAGFNISGLIANAPQSWQQYGFKDNYLATCSKLITRLLSSGAGSIVLIPHVIGEGDATTEVDLFASRALVQSLAPTLRERVFIAGGYQFPTEAKAIIKRLDWFSGSRLHATIGSLSNGVPTSTIAYSDKARGIFDACGVADAVSDPRVLRGDEVVERQVQCFVERARLGAAINAQLPKILQTVDLQMDAIVRLLAATARS